MKHRASIVAAVVVITALILYLITSPYFEHNDTFEITQCDLDDVTMDVLYERNPVVISDQLQVPSHLLDTLFKYAFAFRRESVHPSGRVPHRCLSKFTMVWGSHGGVHVNLVNKRNAAAYLSRGADEFYANDMAEYVTVRLLQNQVLIVPPFWSMMSSGAVHLVELDDLLSRVTRLPGCQR